MCGLVFSSFLRSRRQVFRGLSTFSFHGGSAWGLILWCWWLVYVECGLSNFKRCLISRCTDFWFVCCHSSLLLILSGQRFRRIILRQLLMNVWIFFAVFTVVLQLTAPYSSNDFTLELNSRIFVLVDRYLDVHISLSCRIVALALLILTFYRQMSLLAFRRCCQDRQSFPPQATCLQA